MTETIMYLSDIVIPPTGYVRVPDDLSRFIPGMVAYFTWPISAQTLSHAIKNPHGEVARKIRALSF